MRISLLSLLLFLSSYQSTAQMFPKEGSQLNYRIIGFSVPSEPDVKSYKFEIAAGDDKNIDSFKKHLLFSLVSDSNRLIAEVPAFGASYTWRVVTTNKKDRVKTAPLRHFGTAMNDHVDTTKLRLRILQPAAAHKDDYVSVDAGGVLYDMNGNPVWYVPDTNGFKGNVLNLKFTEQGTVTFLYKDAFEINYDGGLLWKAPNKGIVSGDPTFGEFFHHEFTRLPNGHYMVSGMELLNCKTVITKDTSYIQVAKEKGRIEGYHTGKFGTLIEYDEQGNIVWSWKSSQYLLGSDYDYYESRIDTAQRFDGHDNAFFFDEKNHCIYIGYRNLNRIMKIAYPGGNVLATYGDNFKPGARGVGGGILCNQHSIGRTHDGYLYVFNNNSCNISDSLPTIVMLQEPTSPTGTLKKVWEYTCTVEGDNTRRFGSGGNAMELPDHMIFACMGSEYSKMFIVTRDKKVQWSALPERLMMPDNKWVPVKQFRAGIIGRRELEQLIWNAEKE